MKSDKTGKEEPEAKQNDKDSEANQTPAKKDLNKRQLLKSYSSVFNNIPEIDYEDIDSEEDKEKFKNPLGSSFIDQEDTAPKAKQQSLSFMGLKNQMSYKSEQNIMNQRR